MPNPWVPQWAARYAAFASLRRAGAAAWQAIRQRHQLLRGHVLEQAAAAEAIASIVVSVERKRRLGAGDLLTLEDRPTKRQTPSPPSALASDVSSSVVSTPPADRIDRIACGFLAKDLRRRGLFSSLTQSDSDTRARRAEKRDRHIVSGRYFNPMRGAHRVRKPYRTLKQKWKDDDEALYLASFTQDAVAKQTIMWEMARRLVERETEDDFLVRKRELEQQKAEALEALNQQRLKEAKVKQDEKERIRAKKKRKAAEYHKTRQAQAVKQFDAEKAEYDKFTASLGDKLRDFTFNEKAPTIHLQSRRDKYGRILPAHVDKARHLVPLTDDWEAKVKNALAVRTETSVIGKSVEGVELTRRDLARLLPGEPWLNDEVVNAWYANLCARLNEKDGYVKGPNNVPKWVAYSSAWWKTATSKGVAGIAGWSRRKGIKGEKLLKCERVFFPTNSGVHWTLLTISGTKRTIEYLDSMNTSGYALRKYITLARDWLKMELGDKYKEEEWEVLHTVSAQQNNSNDCGVFACLNGWALAKGEEDLKMAFMAKEIPLARRMFVATLINGGFTGDFDLV